MNQNQPTVLSIDQLKELSRHTVLETLQALGADVKNPLELQRDFQALRDWRRAVEAVKSKALLTSLCIILTGAAAAFWLGFKTICGR